MKFEILFTDYQAEAVGKVLSYINQGIRRIFVLAQAGMGKTTISIHLAEILMGEHRDKKILFISYNRMLKEMIYNRLSLETDCHVECFTLDDNKISIENGYYVTTFYELTRSVKNESVISLGEFDYIISDEFEDYNTEVYSNLIKGTKSTVISFSTAVGGNYDGVIPVLATKQIAVLNEHEIRKSGSKEQTILASQLKEYKETIILQTILNKKLLKEKEHLLKENQKLLQENQEMRKIVEQFEVEKERYQENKKMVECLEQLIGKVIGIETGVKRINDKVDFVKHDVRNGFNEVKNELNEIKVMVSDLMRNLTILQNQVAEKLKYIKNSEEQETLYHDFSEKIMKVIESRIRLDSESGYKIVEQHLVEIFNIINWEKLSDESKKYLITSRLVFNNLVSYDLVDFSPACIPLTKALERELFKRFFSALKTYCIKKCLPVAMWPAGLNYYDIRGNKHKELRDKNFSLGKVAFIIGDNFDHHCQDNKGVNINILEKYFKEELFISGAFRNNEELRNYLSTLSKDISLIREKYRNQAAHKDKITMTDAKDCYDYIIAVTKVLVNLIDKVKV